MLLEMLERTPRGLVTCVFDGTDRVQHMFMRYLDEDHPSRRAEASDAAAAPRHARAIEDAYVQADVTLGRVMERIDPTDARTLVLVLSDHGFAPFRRGINLNAWLLREGLLALRPGADGRGEWLADVDWSRTRAYALGLGGLWLNVRGREAAGVVAPSEAAGLRGEIAGRLTGLCDPEGGAVAVQRVSDPRAEGAGPWLDDAPDLIVGYARGWRASWDGARGVSAGPVFEDNTRRWSGDHCIDPSEVPGVLVANRPLAVAGARIIDIAPTVLALFGVPPPAWMEGRSLEGP
jgi:predicted AlkP superfamily phosphohydrolase/phosphomutase